MTDTLDHNAVVAALHARLRENWTVTVRSARPGSPLIAMFSGSLQKAEPKDDGAGDTDFVWYVGTDDKTYGAFTIPSEGFRAARWEATEKGPMLMVQASDVLIALFPRADDADE
jgi:hypothetical protein